VAGPAKTDPKNAGGPVPATYYYMRSEGVFGGLLVGGVTFMTADKVNRELYGPDVTTSDIVEGKVKPPAGTTILWQALN
jgi:lipid-binding SYLF domain-containing protein